MRRALVGWLATAALAGLSAGAYALRAGGLGATRPLPALANAAPSARQPPTRVESGVLPPEPEPPARGDAARGPYLAAVRAGYERGLANVRQALASEAVDDAHRRSLRNLELGYVDRLDRLRRLAESED